MIATTTFLRPVGVQPPVACRWIDGGLGANYRQIMARLDELDPGNPNAYCFSVVISPDPEAMAEVESDAYHRFVEAVQAIIQEWEDWRLAQDKSPQTGRIEYSFVVHRPEREYGEQMHAHLILPASTEPPTTRDMTPLYNHKIHIEAFKELTYRQLDLSLDRKREIDEPELEVKREREREPELPEISLPEPEIDIGFYGL